MEYVLFLFIFSGNPDTGSPATLIESQTFSSQAACEAAGQALRSFVSEYATAGEKIAAPLVEQERAREGDAFAELAAAFAQGQQARTLCLSR